MAKFDGDWSVPELEAQREDLFRARKARLREVMGRLGMPVLVVLDPNTIRYATGTSNMQLFAQRVPSRYLLLFQDGPAILYEYVGCEHLADAYTTVDEIRAAEGLCMISSGGFPEAAAERFAGWSRGEARWLGPYGHHSVSSPRSSNRTCGFPASGFPTGFTSKHTAVGQDGPDFVGSHRAPRTRPYRGNLVPRDDTLWRLTRK